jgi:hypothetical protein
MGLNLVCRDEFDSDSNCLANLFLQTMGLLHVQSAGHG